MRRIDPSRKDIVRPSLLLLAILAVPAMEIAGFIVVGRQIGVLATLGLIVLSSMAGIGLLRAQGFGLLQRLREDVGTGKNPQGSIVHGALMVVGGLLLIVPGFLTDIVGLLLFIPGVRTFVWSILGKKVRMRSWSTGAAGNPPADGRKTIDLEEGDYSATPKPDSPWARGGRS
jgi:UPF0716 protein FxsA